MRPLLMEWYVARALAAARVALGPDIDPEQLERAVRAAVRELVDAGVAVTDYLAELAFHRVVAGARAEVERESAGGENDDVAA
jgi:hypothetical protein